MKLPPLTSDHIKGHVWPEKVKENVYALAQAGLTYRDIQKKTGMPIGTITRVVMIGDH